MSRGSALIDGFLSSLAAEGAWKAIAAVGGGGIISGLALWLRSVPVSLRVAMFGLGLVVLVLPILVRFIRRSPASGFGDPSSLGATARTILAYAALRGEDVLVTSKVIRLSGVLKFAEAGDPRYPIVRSAVRELQLKGFIGRAFGWGHLRVTDLGHQTVDRLDADQRRYWFTGVR
ncbi:MAG TPA: hypothetical protein VLW17_12185 [Thermoanaerobaculaceae bacterium]|nr:hypothetical protein [Thermoanaerobaculaceae bacterium]